MLQHELQVLLQKEIRTADGEDGSTYHCSIAACDVTFLPERYLKSLQQGQRIQPIGQIDEMLHV